MWTSRQFVIGGSPGIEVNDGAVSLHRVHKVVVVGGYMHSHSTKRIIVHVYAMRSQLVWVEQ